MLITIQRQKPLLKTKTHTIYFFKFLLDLIKGYY